jgi:hypothetical protein
MTHDELERGIRTNQWPRHTHTPWPQPQAPVRLTNSWNSLYWPEANMSRPDSYFEALAREEQHLREQRYELKMRAPWAF